MNVPLHACLYAPYRMASRIIGMTERWLTPVFDLALRLYLAEVFFRSGWLKVSDWSNTLDLFRYVYEVPILPPHVAAAMGTAGELALPVLLVLGLAGRFAAAGLFVLNAVAAISFPDISDLGLRDHLMWGALFLVLFFHGPGRLSLDARLSFTRATSRSGSSDCRLIPRR